MHRWVRGLIVGSLIGAATGGALMVKGRMMNRMERTAKGRARRTLKKVRRRASMINDAAKAGALAFTRKLLD
jgi:hypothetical protein